MVPQQKILRVFKLIRYLNQRPYRTLNQLAQSLDTCTRTVRRYIELLEELNYGIDTAHRARISRTRTLLIVPMWNRNATRWY